MKEVTSTKSNFIQCGISHRLVVDVVTNLSSTTFLSSLNGWISRRWCQHNIILGNGSNFKAEYTPT